MQHKIAKSQIIAFVLSLALMVGIFANSIFANQTANAVVNGDQLAEQIVEEGVVLVKNENNALPLNKLTTQKVNVFGWASTQWIASGCGSGQALSTGRKTAPSIDFLSALTSYGISYNPDLTAMYKAFAGRPAVRTSTNNLNNKPYELCRLYEPSITDTTRYTNELLNGAKAYSDTAIVVIGRITGETHDAPKVQYKGNKSGTAAQTPDDATRTYLEISTEEEALLQYVGANYDKVIVLINAVNTMELGFMDTISGLDSCIVANGTGSTGASALPKVIYGEANPSGKLADIFSYKLNSNPNYYNSGADGEGTYTGDTAGLYPTDYALNSNPVAGKPGVSYVDYVENIYVGYKWYETADAEGYWASKTMTTPNGSKNGYNAVVQYPFGFGLSYTTFSWEIKNVFPATNAYLVKDGMISVDVQVTNTGAVAGKDVVELYYTPPYTRNGIEKSSSNLCAYEKTKLLQPNESQIVSLSFAVEDMSSFDCYDRNANGKSTWELESGEYQVKLMKDSHNVATKVGNIDTTIKFNVKSTIVYDTDSKTGNAVESRFTGAQAEAGVPADGSLESSPVQYLSRGNFAGTIATQKSADRQITSAVKDLNWYSTARADAWDLAQNATMPTTGASNGLAVTTMTGLSAETGSGVNTNVNVNATLTDLGIKLAQDYNAPEWETLLDQIKTTELTKIPLYGARRSPAIPSIGKPATKDPNGPIQVNGWGNSDPLGTGFPTTTLLAQTWNKQLCYDFGNTWGTEARTNGSNGEGWYGPSINMHRNAFNGRNYEYYSEDAYLTGTAVSYTVAGAKDAQVHVYLKHLVLYDQETNRDGLYTWTTEQALREIYLKPFKIAIQRGGATGIMTSYNRIGALWTGGSYSLLTEIVRNEYGFNGAMVSDWPDYPEFMSIDEMLRAGGDLWLNNYGTRSDNYQYQTTSTRASSAALATEQRRAAKDVTFMYLDTKFNFSQFNIGFPVAKADAKAEITSYMANYQFANVNDASAIVNKYSTLIDSSENLLQMQSAVDSAKAELYGKSTSLETKTATIQPGKDDNKKEDEKKGCGSVSDATLPLLGLLALSTSFIFIKLPQRKFSK